MLLWPLFTVITLIIIILSFWIISGKEPKTSGININVLFKALAAIIVLLALIYLYITKKIQTYFAELEKSRQRLNKVSLALEESEERFQKLFDSTADEIFVTNMNQDIVEVNRAACETLGYSRSELLKMKITDIKTKQFADIVKTNREIILKTGFHEFESEHLTKDGRVLSVEYKSTLVHHDSDRMILSIVRNVSKRRMEERQILSAVIQAEERERQRFAKDMHDGLGPLLSTIKLYVNELKSASMEQGEREQLIKHSNELIDEAVNSTRNISDNLMPSIIHSYGLVKALESFCEKVNNTNHLKITIKTENLEVRPEQNLELILFRVVSELINNSIKHSHANKVSIKLLKHEGMICLEYTDDGVGFPVDEILLSEHKGMGLKNIISRVKSINGKYHFSSSPGKGFTLKIEISV
jgi:PAS domain S-box-containing protein